MPLIVLWLILIFTHWLDYFIVTFIVHFSSFFTRDFGSRTYLNLFFLNVRVSLKREFDIFTHMLISNIFGFISAVLYFHKYNSLIAQPYIFYRYNFFYTIFFFVFCFDSMREWTQSLAYVKQMFSPLGFTLSLPLLNLYVLVLFNSRVTCVFISSVSIFSSAHALLKKARGST